MNTGGQAYPGRVQGDREEGDWYAPGMTLHQHYAGLAMRSLIVTNRDIDTTYKAIAERACLFADAMIAEYDRRANTKE